MTEYIERGKTRESYEKLTRSYVYSDAYIADWRLDEMIESIPSADVAPVKHGRWIEYTKVIIPEPYNKWEQAWKCSECGFDDGFVAYNFCPNCGAKMDIPDTEEDDDGDQAN